MKVIILAVLGTILYAKLNLDFQSKVSHLHQLTIIMCVAPVIAVFGAASVWISRNLCGSYLEKPPQMPSSNDLLVLIPIAAIWFAADFCYLGAYSIKGDAITITTILALTPVATALIKYLQVGSFHLNGFHYLSWTLAIAAVVTATIAQNGTNNPPP